MPDCSAVTARASPRCCGSSPASSHRRAGTSRRPPTSRTGPSGSPGVPAGRRIATLADGKRSWMVQRPERVARVGPNGVGKTTLLERLVRVGDMPNSGWLCTDDDSTPGLPGVDGGRAASSLSSASARGHSDRIGYLPQRVDDAFLDRLGIDTTLEVHGDGTMTKR